MSKLLTLHEVAMVTSAGPGIGADLESTVSDIRVKEDIAEVGRLPNGLGLYRYRYLWSAETYVGVMAQEVEDVEPEAVVRGTDGYLRVDYARLGLRLMTWREWNDRYPN
jgi:hypothetical protein